MLENGNRYYYVLDCKRNTNKWIRFCTPPKILSLWRGGGAWSETFWTFRTFAPYSLYFYKNKFCQIFDVFLRKTPVSWRQSAPQFSSEHESGSVACNCLTSYNFAIVFYIVHTYCSFQYLFILDYNIPNLNGEER